jgi:hypothetical protein
MFQRLIDLGVNFDWISPLVALAQDMINGPARAFVLPRDCGWSARQIEHLLKRNGIKIWSLLITGESIMFAVRMAQARWAQYILERAGLLASSGDGDAQGKAADGRVEKSQQSTMVDRLDAWFDRLGDALDL